MAAAAADLQFTRQPAVLEPYNGASGYNYYKGAMLMRDGAGTLKPMVVGAGASNGRFLGVNNNRLDLTAGLGSSQTTLNVFKTGEFTFFANGTGASADIGQRAFAIDDQTVGISAGAPCIPIGEITAIPTTSLYRVKIDAFVGQVMSNTSMGLSWVVAQN